MKNRKTVWIVGVILCAFVILGVTAIVFLNNNLWTGHSFVSRSAKRIDLRDEALSPEDYQRIQDALPDCDIIWNVPFQGAGFASNARMLTVDSLSEEDLRMLAYFHSLSILDATNCNDRNALSSFRTSYPNCLLLYRVTIGGTSYDWDTTELIVSGADIDELRQCLPLLPSVNKLTLKGMLPDADALEALCTDFPQITFLWTVDVFGLPVDNTAEELDLSGKTMEFSAVEKILRMLPNLKKVEIQDTNLTDTELKELILAHPGCFFHCDLDVLGLTFSTDTTYMDISGQPVSDPSEIEKLLPCFPMLERVVMHDCGLSDETMDALNNRYEDIRFVWTVYVQGHPLSTDADYFYPYKMNPKMAVTNEDMEILRYCPDILCIDIGHMWYVTHCEWVKYVPNLRWLILGETRISDLSPLASCKNLVYLEIFTIPVTDYSPLIGCTSLEDLCLGRTYGDPTPLTQMTWLKNVWWANTDWPVGNPAYNAEEILTEALPNTNLRFDLEHPTDDGWRRLDNYYAMRDLMEMFYLR